MCVSSFSGLHVVYQHKVKFLDEEHRIRCERAERERTAALLCVENAYQAQLQTISDEIEVPCVCVVAILYLRQSGV